MIRAGAGIEAIAGDLRRRIRPGEFWFEFTTSPGPGGQNVNKVATRAVLLFPVSSASLSEAERSRIRSKLAGRISGEGVLRVTSSKYRSQQANRLAAQERFFELIATALTRPKPRRKTRISAAAKARRVNEKRRRGVRKQERRLRPDGA